MVPRETKSSSDKEVKTKRLIYYATKKQVTHQKKRFAKEIRVLRLGCDSSNVYVIAWSDQLKKKINIYVDTGSIPQS